MLTEFVETTEPAHTDAARVHPPLRGNVEPDAAPPGPPGRPASE